MDRLTELVNGAVDDMHKRRAVVSAFDLRMLADVQVPPQDVLPRLQDKSQVGLIAEIKRSSPSKGKLAEISDVAALAREYEAAGASMISVLTEPRYFGGTLSDLRAVSEAVSIPVLRKDFIVDTYQVLEARANGADCILLIAAAFEVDSNGGFEQLRTLIDYSHELGMRVLLECHTFDEVKLAKALDVRIIGINARDLKTFAVDREIFATYSKLLGAEIVKVAESGVSSVQDFLEYAKAGADAVLVGEGLVKAENRQLKAEQFMEAGIRLRRGDFAASASSDTIAPAASPVASVQLPERQDRNLVSDSPLSKQNGPYFGKFGGTFVPEALVAALKEFETAYKSSLQDDVFQRELKRLQKTYISRPSIMTEVPRFANHIGQWINEQVSGMHDIRPRVFIKREDLNHTGAHKINNALGQALLAKNIGKKRIIAETGAGQHGVATATVCAFLGLECTIYMGAVDAKRQALNVARMRLLGAKVVQVQTGDAILKDAINEALRDWVENVGDTHYLLGTVAGPHPFPTIVRDFQKVIGEEAKEQIKEFIGEYALPDAVVACVGGGSNAIGIFNAFLDDAKVQLFGFEAGGKGLETGKHATRFSESVEDAKSIGTVGVFQGAKSYLLQDDDGQTLPTHSISAGLDYASVGPEHPWLREIGRVQYGFATDDEAMQAFGTLSRLEGIIPALESAHALAGAYKAALDLVKQGNKTPAILINLSGRGDKDVATASSYFGILEGEEVRL